MNHNYQADSQYHIRKGRFLYFWAGGDGAAGREYGRMYLCFQDEDDRAGQFPTDAKANNRPWTAGNRERLSKKGETGTKPGMR